MSVNSSWPAPVRKQSGPLGSLCFLLFAATILVIPAGAVPTGKNLLEDVTVAERRASFTATQVIKLGDGPREVAKIWRNANKKRVEWLEPEVRRGDVLVDDGTNAWLFHKAENTATQTKSAALPDYRNSTTVGVKETTLNGKPVYAMELSTGALLWVDKAKKVRLRLENGWSSVVLSDVKFGYVPPSRFKFETPAGARVTRTTGTLVNNLSTARKSASWLRAPSQLPTGYAFESAVVDAGEVWLRYTNGRRRFSLFQQKGEGADVQPTKVDNGWFWKQSGTRFLVTGAPASSVPILASSLK